MKLHVEIHVWLIRPHRPVQGVVNTDSVLTVVSAAGRSAPSLAALGLAAVDKEGKTGFRDLSGFRDSYVTFAVRDNHSF